MSNLKIRFLRDFVSTEGFKFGVVDNGVASTYQYYWVASRSNPYEVTEGTPTATAGETSALNFEIAFNLDFPSGFTVVTDGNLIDITSNDPNIFFNGLTSSLVRGVDYEYGIFNQVDDFKINTKSPYFLNIDMLNSSAALIDLYIYKGQRGIRPIEPAFSIKSTNIDESSVTSVNISALIDDFVENNFNGKYEQEICYADAVVKLVDENIIVVDSYELSYRCFAGYGYFEEGANPELSKKALVSNQRLIKLASGGLSLPVDSTLSSAVYFEQSNGAVLINNINSPSDSSSEIVYATDIAGASREYKDRVEAEDGIIENHPCLDGFFEEITFYPTEKITVVGRDGSVEVIDVKNIYECKYETYKTTFLNKFGALQDLWFFKVSKENLSVEEEMFRGNTFKDGGYNTSDHQYQVFNKMGKKTISLNSGFYPEEYNEVFTQMLLSDKVWIDYKGETLPVVIKSKELSYKTRLNDSLIQYKIDLEFAFDTKNSVR